MTPKMARPESMVLAYICLHKVNVNANSPYILIHYYKFATWSELKEIHQTLKLTKSANSTCKLAELHLRKLALNNRQLDRLLSPPLLFTIVPCVINIVDTFSGLLIAYRSINAYVAI